MWSIAKKLKACQILPEHRFIFLAIYYCSQAQADFQKTQLFVPPSHSPRLRRTKQFHYQVINHKQRNLRDFLVLPDNNPQRGQDPFLIVEYLNYDTKDETRKHYHTIGHFVRDVVLKQKQAHLLSRNVIDIVLDLYLRAILNQTSKTTKYFFAAYATDTTVKYICLRRHNLRQHQFHPLYSCSVLRNDFIPAFAKHVKNRH